MKKIKRWMALCCAVVLLLCAAGCKAAPASDDGKLKVVATIFPPYDFARQIAGTYAEVSMLLKPGAESHTYEPSPADILQIQNCDVFLYNGGESDAWVDEILQSIDTTGMKIVKMMDSVRMLEEETVEGMQQEQEAHGSHDGHEVEYDEHVWTSPKNALAIAQEISAALIGADAEHAQQYRDACTAYAAQLEALDKEFEQIAAQGTRKLMVFGDRFPMRYFADAYGLSYRAAFPGCARDAEPSAQTMAYLIDLVKEEQIPVVFYIEFSSKKVANAISEATGAKLLLFHSCHNVSRQELDAGETYISLQKQNAGNLKAALG